MTEAIQETIRKREDYVLETDVVATHIPALRLRLRAFISGGIRQLSLDFSNVHMVDSAGIGLIIATHNSLQKLGGVLELTGVAPEIGDLFQGMRMHQHFRISGAE